MLDSGQGLLFSALATRSVVQVALLGVESKCVFPALDTGGGSPSAHYQLKLDFHRLMGEASGN